MATELSVEHFDVIEDIGSRHIECFVDPGQSTERLVSVWKIEDRFNLLCHIDETNVVAQVRLTVFLVRMCG